MRLGGWIKMEKEYSQDLLDYVKSEQKRIDELKAYARESMAKCKSGEEIIDNKNSDFFRGVIHGLSYLQFNEIKESLEEKDKMLISQSENLQKLKNN